MYISPEYDWTFEHAAYNNFKKGKIKCPYESRYFDIGYLGEGKYKMCKNGKHTDEFKIWYHMLERCYDPNYKENIQVIKGVRLRNIYSISNIWESGLMKIITKFQVKKCV